jgi:excisionase family DNA binding protein
MLSLDFAAFRSEVNAPVMQEIGTTSACPRLLTVKEAATRLRTSTATVYGLCERGRLPYVRISTHAIRIAEQDFSAFVGSRRSSET